VKLSKKSRRLIRVICRGLGATTIPLAFGACPFPFAAMYGPGPVRESLEVRGRVVSKNTGLPIPSIAIWASDDESWVTTSDFDGGFWLFLGKQDEYTFIFTDVDGTANGLFRQHTLLITRAELEALDGSPLIIELEEVEADAE